MSASSIGSDGHGVCVELLMDKEEGRECWLVSLCNGRDDLVGKGFGGVDRAHDDVLFGLSGLVVLTCGLVVL